MTLLAQYQPQSLSPLQLMLPQMLCFAFQQAPNGTDNLEEFEKHQVQIQGLEIQLKLRNEKYGELNNITKSLESEVVNLRRHNEDVRNKMVQAHRNSTLQKQVLEDTKHQLQHKTNDPRLQLLDQMIRLKQYEDQCRRIHSEVEEHKEAVLLDIEAKKVGLKAAADKTNNLQREFDRKQTQINAIKLQIQLLKKEIEVKMNVASAATSRRKQYKTPAPKPTAQDTEEQLKQAIKKEALKKTKEEKEQLIGEAAATGNLTMLKVLADMGVDLTAPDSTGLQPLDWAVVSGDTDTTKALIALGADGAKPNNDGDTPLHLAARKGHTEIAKLLLDSGVDPNIRNTYQSTPLHEAAFYGFADFCRFLLQNGAYVNLPNGDQNTPIHFAAMRGNLEIVKLLEEQGADLSVVNADGNTPQKEADDARMYDVASWIASQ